MHGIVGFAHRTEHPVGNGAQVRALLLVALRQPGLVSHGIAPWLSSLLHANLLTTDPGHGANVTDGGATRMLSRGPCRQESNGVECGPASTRPARRCAILATTRPKRHPRRPTTRRGSLRTQGVNTLRHSGRLRLGHRSCDLDRAESDGPFDLVIAPPISGCKIEVFEDGVVRKVGRYFDDGWWCCGWVEACEEGAWLTGKSGDDRGLPEAVHADEVGGNITGGSSVASAGRGPGSIVAGRSLRSSALRQAFVAIRYSQVRSEARCGSYRSRARRLAASSLGRRHRRHGTDPNIW